MKKLRLELDTLAVESFDTTRDDMRRGTVRGMETDYTVCLGNCGEPTGGGYCSGTCANYTTSCDTEYTNCGDRTCDYTCGSCNASCAGVPTSCQATCVDQICLATQPPFCEG
ncbi:MAG TPA: hypothetical protein VFQ39_15560 [Longimicrobium sp.]|nr:hypothetical protein [Longimicrobium sp.]